MFDSLVKAISDAGGGVRAYDACARAARARIAKEPDNSAALLLISYAAQRFVESYDDQPLTVEEAAEEFNHITGMVTLLGNAFAGGSAEAKLDAMNEAARRLADTHRTDGSN
ncbi:MAG: hypothetical protein R3D45_15375 [Rhizobiaceae bacterium]